MLPGVRSARPLHAAGLVAALASLPGCASADSDPPTLVVFAAASLSGVFEDVGRDFEESTGESVTFNFAGSSDLVAQLDSGATADVLATADERTMDAASTAGLLSAAPSVFARNRLTIAIAPGNPAGIQSLDDLTGKLVVVCAPQVPCGAATAELAERAGLDLRPVSEESSVTDVLAKVGSGQADAGVVYRTDLRRAADGVDELVVPDEVNVATSYPIAVLEGGAGDAAAARFVEFVLGEAGQRALAEAGFEAPA